MKNQVQLITYVDRIGCKNLTEFKSLLNNELEGMFGGVHLLPFYYPIDGEDAGFDPIDHKTIDPRLGTWDDLEQLGNTMEIMSDLVVNHMSAQSAEFQDFLQKGDRSDFAGLFLTFDKVFPNGATEEQLLKIYRPRPGFPFTKMKFGDGGDRLMWTTFTSGQIDIDVLSKKGSEYLVQILDRFQQAGVGMIRLDAAGYALKKAGTTCFMTEDTFAFIEQLTQKAKERDIEVLVEIHSYYRTQIQIAKRVDYVYDFALPVLVLDTLFNSDTTNLKNWLAISPRNCITVLDTHDGIGIVDVASENGEDGLIDDGVLDAIVEKIHNNSKGESMRATGTAASNVDLYQVNCTYFDALGQSETDYFLARAIQFFVPGIPQVYYVGLFAGTNDMELLTGTNVGRNINRHYYTKAEIVGSLEKPLVKKLRKLMAIRNAHVAFNGDFKLMETPDHLLHMKWEKEGEWISLQVDLSTRTFLITGSQGGNGEKVFLE
ncbi:MAG: sucrose phosphorylase [Flavobacteriaceae bacterium]